MFKFASSKFSILKRVYNIALSHKRFYKKVSLSKDIFCQGEILHDVQLKYVFGDSKTFVDLKLKSPADDVFLNYYKLKEDSGGDINIKDLENFLEENFESEHTLSDWEPTDWLENPPLIDKIADGRLKQFALDVNSIWKILGRTISEDVLNQSDKYSLLYVPEPFIIPGGRFREFYYWDSYWIICGLLLSGMSTTVRGMISNYLYLVDEFGIIPNGGRIYYMDRSQPPMLIPMVDKYVEVTNDIEFLYHALPGMEKEFMFWQLHRLIKVERDGETYDMFRYNSESFDPRPESYREDYEHAHTLPEEVRESFYNNVRAAAESGMDFSCRWYVPHWKPGDPFTNTNTTSVIPVCLNAIMQWNARLLSKYFAKINIDYKASFYNTLAQRYQRAIDKVLWNEEAGIWLDWDLINKGPRDKFFCSNFAPLWSGSFDKNANLGPKVVNYCKKSGILAFDGGLPTSPYETGQQWDFPNCWAPHQEFVITGLDNTGDPESQKLAMDFAKQWIIHNYLSYKQDQAMYEKYHAYMIHTGGGGGEYENQVGFGWSNGTLLMLLDKYSDYIMDVNL